MSWSNNNHGCSGQFLFLIVWIFENLLMWKYKSKWFVTYYKCCDVLYKDSSSGKKHDHHLQYLFWFVDYFRSSPQKLRYKWCMWFPLERLNMGAMSNFVFWLGEKNMIVVDNYFLRTAILLETKQCMNNQVINSDLEGRASSLEYDVNLQCMNNQVINSGLEGRASSFEYDVNYWYSDIRYDSKF